MNDEQPKQLVIPLATAEAVVNYLAQRPYVEVFQLIAAMHPPSRDKPARK